MQDITALVLTHPSCLQGFIGNVFKQGCVLGLHVGLFLTATELILQMLDPTAFQAEFAHKIFVGGGRTLVAPVQEFLLIDMDINRSSSSSSLTSTVPVRHAVPPIFRAGFIGADLMSRHDLPPIMHTRLIFSIKTATGKRRVRPSLAFRPWHHLFKTNTMRDSATHVRARRHSGRQSLLARATHCHAPRCLS